MKIYVGNISFDTTNAMLREAFSKFGEVVSAGVALDRETGRSKGFGVVEMAQPRQAVDAMEALNGTELGGRTIKVGEFTPKSGNRGRFGGGDRGGRGGKFGRGGRGGRNFRGRWGGRHDRSDNEAPESRW